MEPRDLLRALMQRDGDNPHSLSAKLKGRVKQPQIYKFIEGIAKEPRRSTLQPLAEHYDIPVDAFYDQLLATATARRLRLEAGDTAALSLVAEPKPAYRIKPAQELVIRQYQTGGSMGAGLLLRDQPGMINSWSVTPEWVQKNVPNVSNPRFLAIVTGFGDSMRPLYNPGDPLLVDTGVKTVEYDGVYFFRIGNEGFIKRLQRVPGQGLLAISENKSYRDWVIAEGMDFEVFGRVVKIWKGDEF